MPVRTAVQQAGLDYESAEVSFVPEYTQEVDAATAEKLMRIIDALEDSDDVQNVYANFDASDDVLAQNQLVPDAGSNGTVPEIALRPIDIDDWAAVHEWASTIEACRYQEWGPNTARRDQGLRRSGGQQLEPPAAGSICVGRRAAASGDWAR